MRHVTIAVIGTVITDNLTILPPSFDCGDTRYTIHSSPKFQYAPTSEGMQVIKNFDLMLDFSMGDDQYFKQLGSCHYQQFKRLPKTNQLIQGLNARGRLKPSDQDIIEIPGFYLTLGDTGNHLLSNYGAGDLDRLVVKPENGARGASQAIVPASHLSLVLNDLNERKLSRAEMVNKYPGVRFSDYPNEEGVPFLDRHDTLMVMDYLPDIDAEYRILLAGDTIRGYQRDKGNGDFKQANLDFAADVPEAAIELKELDELFTATRASAVRKFIKELGLTFGSVDLYSRGGKIGLFEFCPQFGFYRMDPTVIQQLHMYFIIDAVDRYAALPHETVSEQYETPNPTIARDDLYISNRDLPAGITPS